MCRGFDHGVEIYTLKIASQSQEHINSSYIDAFKDSISANKFFLSTVTLLLLKKWVILVLTLLFYQ
jgi:hypothetical protein